jgi:hypothetical protein
LCPAVLLMFFISAAVILFPSVSCCSSHVFHLCCCYSLSNCVLLFFSCISSLLLLFFWCVFFIFIFYFQISTAQTKNSQIRLWKQLRKNGYHNLTIRIVTKGKKDALKFCLKRFLCCGDFQSDRRNNRLSFPTTRYSGAEAGAQRLSRAKPAAISRSA